MNETDFITLDPLMEIPALQFYSYKIDGHIYGCNIISLGQFIKKNGTKQQPYNQSPFPEEVIKDIIQLSKITNILYDNPNIELIREPNNTVGSNIENLRRFLLEIRRKSVDTRIHELFMEIDQLGNYTNSTWFSNLSVDGYLIFYRSLYSIWNYRGRLTNEIKQKIFILGNPFVGFQINESQTINTIYMKEACLFVFENLVYGGIDEDHKKLGTFHALSALTLASIHARNSMYWLYESLM
jgi:hypothetical protein